MCIWELPNWPKFKWDDKALALLLADAHKEQGRLLGRMEALGFKPDPEAHLQTFTNDVVESSAIEGEKFNVEEVRSSVARRLRMDVAGLVPSGKNVDGVVEMVVDATRNYSEPLTERRLFVWHSLLFPEGLGTGQEIRVGSSVGMWRDDGKGPMQVVSGPAGHERVHYEAPPAARVPGEMQRFFDWFNGESSTDLFVKACLAHLWFVTIHPFGDGNGRIARALMDMTLARAEDSDKRFYSMSAQIRRERKDYYATLERTQKGDLDVTLHLTWFLGCLSRAIVAAEERLESVFHKSRFWARFAGESLNERQRKVLARLLDGFEGKLTTKKWAKLAKCSHDTALRDIADLIERGALKKDPGGGRSTSYSLAEASNPARARIPAPPTRLRLPKSRN